MTRKRNGIIASQSSYLPKAINGTVSQNSQKNESCGLPWRWKHQRECKYRRKRISQAYLILDMQSKWWKKIKKWSTLQHFPIPKNTSPQLRTTPTPSNWQLKTPKSETFQIALGRAGVWKCFNSEIWSNASHSPLIRSLGSPSQNLNSPHNKINPENLLLNFIYLLSVWSCVEMITPAKAQKRTVSS